MYGGMEGLGVIPGTLDNGQSVAGYTYNAASNTITSPDGVTKDPWMYSALDQFQIRYRDYDPNLNWDMTVSLQPGQTRPTMADGSQPPSVNWSAQSIQYASAGASVPVAPTIVEQYTGDPLAGEATQPIEMPIQASPENRGDVSESSLASMGLSVPRGALPWIIGGVAAYLLFFRKRS